MLFRDAVGPVDRTVVRVARISGQPETGLDIRDLACGEADTIKTFNALDCEGRRWRIGEIQIGEVNRAAVGQG